MFKILNVNENNFQRNAVYKNFEILSCSRSPSSRLPPGQPYDQLSHTQSL